jgi:hypothetical protein
MTTGSPAGDKCDYHTVGACRDVLLMPDERQAG